MRYLHLAFLGLLLAIPMTARAALPTVVAVGDSYTRQTPCTNTDYYVCDGQGLIHHELSYASILNGATRYTVASIDNSGRGGDTCTTQAAYADGPWAGENRGVLAQVDARINNRSADAVSILLGINDANLYGVNEATIQQCLEDLLVLITGKKIIVMTYPKFATTTTVWPISGAVAASNRLYVNNAIRNAVANHNANYPTANVRLVDLDAAWTSAQVNTYTLSDHTHPNSTGALRIARKWYEQVCASPTYLTGCTFVY